MNWKPDNYPSVSPYLVVHGAEGVIDFCKTLFGAEELRRYTRADGTIMHAEVRVDDSVIMIADATAEWGARPGLLHVYVPDVDDVYHRALDLGATSVQEPAQKDDPDRRAGVTDKAGNSWWFGTQVGQANRIDRS